MQQLLKMKNKFKIYNDQKLRINQFNYLKRDKRLSSWRKIYNHNKPFYRQPKTNLRQPSVTLTNQNS